MNMFKMKDFEEAHYYFGITIQRDRANGVMTLQK